MAEKYALLSVADKSGIVPLARAVKLMGFEIIATGGTAKTLADAGIQIIPIQEITGSPESFDGRMKTISFEIESGILFDRTKPSHVKQAKKLGIRKIDLVVANLYPFEQTVKNQKAVLNQVIENVDVGGPTMLRAAAKNFKNVLAVVDPKDYEIVIKALKVNSVSDELRQSLAAKTFGHLSFYDAQIAKYLNHKQFPEEISLPGRKKNNTSLRRKPASARRGVF